MDIQPIGYLWTCFGSKFAVPRQPGLCPSAWGVLEFEESYRFPEVVRGLEGFSHIWLIFGFHEHDGKPWQPTVRPPRLGGNARVGVFASRSTYRPNGLGLSLVKLDRVVYESEDGRLPPILHVSGVDIVDGTPIYDIKPYLAYAESKEAVSGYAVEEPERMEVEIGEGARMDFMSLDDRSQKIILEVLSLDPRPAVSPQTEERVYGAVLCGKEVRFTIHSGVCRVVEIADVKLSE